MPLRRSDVEWWSGVLAWKGCIWKARIIMTLVVVSGVTPKMWYYHSNISVILVVSVLALPTSRYFPIFLYPRGIRFGTTSLKMFPYIQNVNRTMQYVHVGASGLKTMQNVHRTVHVLGVLLNVHIDAGGLTIQYASRINVNAWALCMYCSLRERPIASGALQASSQAFIEPFLLSILQIISPYIHKY